jgi:hypothetical protein
MILYSVSLWPFTFQAPRIVANGIEWRGQGNGIDVPTESFAVSKKPATKLVERILVSNAISFELWLSSARLNQFGPARILSFSADTWLRNFTLGQEEANLVLRFRTTKNNLNGTNPALTFPKVFTSSDVRHLVVTYDGQTTKVYVNGEVIAETRELSGWIQNWDRDYFLNITNENTRNRPWFGSLYLIAVYDRILGADEIAANYRAGYGYDDIGLPAAKRSTKGLVLCYSFDEGSGDTIQNRGDLGPTLDLSIPEHFLVIPNHFEMIPRQRWRWDLGLLKDFVQNLLLFLPFGFLSVTLLVVRSRNASLLHLVVTLSFSLAVSVSIEFLQMFLPSRRPTLSDIILNLAGALAGGYVAFAFISTGRLVSEESKAVGKQINVRR